MFITVYQRFSLKWTHLFFFAHFLEYALLFLDESVDEESEYFSNSKRLASGCCSALLDFFQFQPGVAHKKMLLAIKKTRMLGDVLSVLKFKIYEITTCDWLF